MNKQTKNKKNTILKETEESKSEIILPHVKDLTFIKCKKEDRTRIYILVDSNKKKPRIKLNNVYIPFGVEKYKKYNIINFEIRPKQSKNHDHDHYNIYSILSGFENEISDKLNLPNEVEKEIGENKYSKNLRESKCGYIIRSHIFSTPKIYTIISGFEYSLMTQDINNTIANVDLELGMFWISEDSYGYVWYVKEINVLGNEN